MSALSLIQNLVSGLTGMNTAACGPNALLPAVHKRMKALSITDQTDYYRRLLLARTELDALIEELVVPETWFFRDGVPFELLVRHVRETGAADRLLRLLSVPVWGSMGKTISATVRFSFATATFTGNRRVTASMMRCAARSASVRAICWTRPFWPINCPTMLSFAAIC